MVKSTTDFYLGFDYVYYPLRNGQRVSSSDAFLEPIKQRSRLTVRKYALVAKVCVVGI